MVRSFLVAVALLAGARAAAAPDDARATPPAAPCPDIVELFSRHLESEISSSVCAEMEKHLARCPDCQSRCDSLQRTLALCRATPLPEVPKAVQADVRRALQKFIALHE